MGWDVDRYEDQVVQDNFKFGDDKEIVSPGSDSAVNVKGRNGDIHPNRSWLCKTTFWH